MKRIARLSLGILMAAATAGCTRWQYTHPLPAPGEAPRTFGAARVTVAGQGTVLVLRDVQVSADSVTGWLGKTPGQRQRLAIHRKQVVILDRRASDPWGTAGVSLLTVVVAYVAVVGYFLSSVMI
ncbi:MAG TPA: hypothetical protein VK358_06915 [Longimicrobium sp.]|nr:hypothetical protein [Longimicrobium sp.]